MQPKWDAIDGVMVVGITGHARHGKDTLAQALLTTVPGSERWALSDAVAVVARVYHGMKKRDAWTLQAVGTGMRTIDPTVWLRCVHGAIEDKRPPLAIITGIRYPDEAQMVRDLGGIMVGIVQPHRPAADDRDANHPVEAHIEQLLSSVDVRFSMPHYPDARERAAAFASVAKQIAASLLINDLPLVDVKPANAFLVARSAQEQRFANGN